MGGIPIVKILLSQIVVLSLSVSAWAGRTAPEHAGRDTPAAEKDLFEMSIEELMDVSIDTVYGASKYPQKLSDAPASVTIITADEIRRYGYRTLAEVLRSAPGFYINYDRNYHYVGTRGFRRPGDYDTRILLLVNGHRINENVGDSPPFGTQFPVDIDLIERVEIIRGPGASLYISNAMLAVVNVITKQGAGLRGLELSGEAASFDTYKGRVTYGNLFGEDLDLLLSASTYDSRGPELHFAQFDTPETNHGRTDNDDDQFDNIFAHASWGNLSLVLAHTGREKGIPTAPWDTVFGDPRTRTWDDTTLVGLTYSRELSENWTINSRLAYGQYDCYGQWVSDRAGDGEDPYIVIDHDEWRGRWWDGELQLLGRPAERHTVMAGAEVRYNARQDLRAWDEEIYLDDSGSSKNWGVYFQDEFKLTKKLALVGGLRHDRYDSFGGTTNPRLAVIYNVFDKTTLKLLYGNAFRAPNAYELRYHDGGYTQKPSLDLDPETMKTYEIVVEQELSRQLRASASGFHYAMDGLISQYVDPADGLLVFKNLDRAEATGLELSLLGRWPDGLTSRVSYSYVDAEDGTTGETLVDSPRHLAKLNLIAPVVRERLFAGLEVLHDSKARTLGDHYTDDFTLTNVTLAYVSASKRLEVSAGLYNLFDTRYAYPGFGEHVQGEIEQDGRTFRVKLTYRF